MAGPLVLHSADLHLGGPVAAPYPALESLAAHARADSLKRLVELTGLRRPALVCLSGDIFDAPRPPLTAVLSFEQSLKGLLEAGAAVFIAPGNHDPWEVGSFWEAWRPPEGVVVFGPEPSGVALPELGLWVAGAAHDRAHVTEDLAGRLPAPPEGLAGVAVLHAHVSGLREGAEHDPYAPVRLDRLRRAPFALWALGHWHTARQLCQRPAVAYCGTPQGAHMGEPGERGAYLWDLGGPEPAGEFVPLAPLAFHDLALDDLAQVRTPGQLAARLAAELPADQSWEHALCLRLTLSGPSPLWEMWRDQPAGELAGALARELGLAGLVLRDSGLLPPVDPAELAHKPHVLGRLLAQAAQAAQDPALLEALAAELGGGLHPAARGRGAKQRVQRLSQVLDDAVALALKDLWRGGVGGGRAA